LRFTALHNTKMWGRGKKHKLNL